MKENGWACREVKNKDECKGKCEQDKILITLYWDRGQANKTTSNAEAIMVILMP